MQGSPCTQVSLADRAAQCPNDMRIKSNSKMAAVNLQPAAQHAINTKCQGKQTHMAADVLQLAAQHTKFDFYLCAMQDMHIANADVPNIPKIPIYT